MASNPKYLIRLVTFWFQLGLCRFTFTTGAMAIAMEKWTVTSSGKSPPLENNSCACSNHFAWALLGRAVLEARLPRCSHALGLES